MNDLHELAICGESLIIVLSCCIINGLNGHSSSPSMQKKRDSKLWNYQPEKKNSTWWVIIKSVDFFLLGSAVHDALRRRRCPQRIINASALSGAKVFSIFNLFGSESNVYRIM